MSDDRVTGPDQINTENIKTNGHELWKDNCNAVQSVSKGYEDIQQLERIEDCTAVQERRQRRSEELSTDLSAFSHL